LIDISHLQSNNSECPPRLAWWSKIGHYTFFSNSQTFL